MADKKTDITHTDIESDDVESRSAGASQSGVVNTTSEVQPTFDISKNKPEPRSNKSDPEVERLLDTPLEDQSIIGSGEPGDPTTPRSTDQTLTDAP